MEQDFRFMWLSLNGITDSEIDQLLELIGFYNTNSKYIAYSPSTNFFFWREEIPPHLIKDKSALVTNSFTEFMAIVNEYVLNQILGIDYE